MVIAKSVEWMGYPLGNMWDIYVDCIRDCRVTYHGDTLFVVRGYTGTQRPSVESMEQAIDRLYAELH